VTRPEPVAWRVQRRAGPLTTNAINEEHDGPPGHRLARGPRLRGQQGVDASMNGMDALLGGTPGGCAGATGFVRSYDEHARRHGNDLARCAVRSGPSAVGVKVTQRLRSSCAAAGGRRRGRGGCATNPKAAKALALAIALVELVITGRDFGLLLGGQGGHPAVS